MIRPTVTDKSENSTTVIVGEISPAIGKLLGVGVREVGVSDVGGMLVEGVGVVRGVTDGLGVGLGVTIVTVAAENSESMFWPSDC